MMGVRVVSREKLCIEVEQAGRQIGKIQQPEVVWGLDRDAAEQFVRGVNSNGSHVRINGKAFEQRASERIEIELRVPDLPVDVFAPDRLSCAKSETERKIARTGA